MRAFAITLDSLVAIAFVFLAALMLYSQTFYSYAPRGTYLKQITLDTLTVLEKTGEFGYAIDENSLNIRSMLRATPIQICMQLTLTNSTGHQIFTIVKDDCREHGRELQVVTMPVEHDGKIYSVFAQSWYKKGSE